MRFFRVTGIDNIPGLVQQLFHTFKKVEDEIDKLDSLPELHVVPDKLSHGKLYFADGTDWNPGSGRGIYMYDSSTSGFRYLG